MTGNAGKIAPVPSLIAMGLSGAAAGGMLFVAARLVFAPQAAGPMLAGWAGVGAGLSVAAGVAVWRSARAQRLGTLVRDALAALAGGERSVEALELDPSLGQVAEAWNTLVRERGGRERRADAERVSESLRSRVQSRGELHDAWDAVPNGMLIIDHELRVKHGNGAAAGLLGRERNALVGAAVDETLMPPEVVAAVRGLVCEGQRTRSNFEVRREEGQGGGFGVLRYSVRPLRREDAGEALVTIEDVTQQRVADQARNAFVAQATHELRTPLTNIRLYVEELLDGGEDDPEARGVAINTISKEARRLDRIVADILSVSEIEAGSLRLREDDVRLEQIVKDLETDYAAQAEEKSITLKFDLPPKFPVIRGDRDKVELALHNLLGNALKYTPAGGTVTLRFEDKDEVVRIDVEDSGIGIAEDEQEKIFEKFYRSKDGRVSHVTGTGLGLAIAREVVRLHGGDITLRSEVDKGSTFTLQLPHRRAA